MKIITHFDVELDGCIYHATIRIYDPELKHYTADWFCAANGKRGSLDFGLPSCHSVESEATKKIREEHKI